jgi:hypothetical protein
MATEATTDAAPIAMISRAERIELLTSEFLPGEIKTNLPVVASPRCLAEFSVTDVPFQ